MDVSAVKKNVSSSTSQANAVIADHAAAKMRCQGIIPLYIDFADDHVQRYEQKGKVKKISREKVELQLLQEIDNSDFPIEFKLSCYHAVLASQNFDAYWRSVYRRHKLPESCTKRYVTDQDFLEYDVPTDDEAEEEAEEEGDHEADDGVGDDTPNGIHDNTTAANGISPTSVPQTPALVTDHGSRFSTPDSPDISSRESSPDTWPQLSAAALAPVKRVLPRCANCNLNGQITRFCPCRENKDDSNINGRSIPSYEVEYVYEAKLLDERLGALDEDPPAASGYLNGLTREEEDDSNGLAREEEDDSEYEDTPSKNKGKGKAIATPTVKGASKPKGVTKNKAVPKKKEQTPAQLKTAAAKTREPAKPKATKPKGTKKAATTTSSQSGTQRVHAPSNGNNHQSQALTVPDELGQKIAQVQENFAPAQAAGIKRMMEQFPDDNDDDDEDDSPAAKKAKIGGAASANGGRKKATPKKSNKKKDDFEEWDGIPRGFGEY